MKTIAFALLFLLFISCNNTQTNACDGTLGCDNICNSGAVLDECGICNGDNSSCKKIYITLQGTDKVAILNASTLELIEEVNIELMEGMMSTPHYVVLDEENGYWFISAIMPNKIAKYPMISSNGFIGAALVDIAIKAAKALNKIVNDRSM